MKLKAHEVEAWVTGLKAEKHRRWFWLWPRIAAACMRRQKLCGTLFG